MSNAMSTASTFKRNASHARGTGTRLPNAREVLSEHVRMIGFALRIPLWITAALGLLATIVFAMQIVTDEMNRNLVTQPSSLPGIVGALLAIAVWAREERFGPGFLWTLPVDRSRHALMKVLAGWLWLMGGVVLFTVALLVLTVLSGSSVLPAATMQVLASPIAAAGPIDPASIQPVQWMPGPLIWIIPFASATATYLLTSAFMVGVRYPLRWIGGGIGLFAVTNVGSHMLGRMMGLEWLSSAPERALAQLIQGRYGLEALHTLRTWSLDSRATLTTGERIHVWSSLPNLGEWRIAALLWLAAGALALWLAASRHRESRRA